MHFTNPNQVSHDYSDYQGAHDLQRKEAEIVFSPPMPKVLSFVSHIFPEKIQPESM